MNTPDQLLANILEQHEPQSLLVLGTGNIPALSNYLAENAVELNHFSLAPDLTLADTQQRFDLCLLTPEFILLDKPHAIELLAGIRNRLCHRIYVVLSMLKEGVDIAFISRVTGLSLKAIETLHANIPAS